jgi:hypothetical protein
VVLTVNDAFLPDFLGVPLVVVLGAGLLAGFVFVVFVVAMITFLIVKI